MTAAGPLRAFWRTDSVWPSRAAADRRARSCRWAPTVIERGLAVRVTSLADGRWSVDIGANDARLLRVRGG